MSAGARTLTVAPRFERSTTAPPRDLSREGREWVRLSAFAALASYGVVRWATLLHPAPTARLIGLLAVAVAMAGGVPLLRRRDPVWPFVLALVLVLIALPVAGLPWQWFIHDRIALSARLIGGGLSTLPDVVVPYSGAGHAVRLVVTLGAGVLLLDAAAVVAFAPSSFGDLRRAGAALPLVALAIVPSTLVRPQLPYLQGLVLFGLLAAFQWGDRVRRDGVGAALVLAALIGVGAAAAAPRLDLHKPWLNYRAWAGTLGVRHVDSFEWNQTYGPLHWPRSGHSVLTVQAKQGDYWKAQALDRFDGYAWVQGVFSNPLPPAAPSRSELARWTQRIDVTITGMRSHDVIAAGVAGPPAIPGGALQGTDPGAWVAVNQLGPGATYSVDTYSPRPSSTEMTAAKLRQYPTRALQDYLTLGVPSAGASSPDASQITFPLFHAAGRPTVTTGAYVTDGARLVMSSPYRGRLRPGPPAGGACRHPVCVRDQRRAVPVAGLPLQRETTATRLPAGELPVPGQDRLLPAVLGRDGAAVAHGRRAGAGRGRLHLRHAGPRRAHLGGLGHRRARVGRGVVPALRLGPV